MTIYVIILDARNAPRATSQDYGWMGGCPAPVRAHTGGNRS
jgi:hypothetical protein